MNEATIFRLFRKSGLHDSLYDQFMNGIDIEEINHPQLNSNELAELVEKRLDINPDYYVTRTESSIEETEPIGSTTRSLRPKGLRSPKQSRIEHTLPPEDSDDDDQGGNPLKNPIRQGGGSRGSGGGGGRPALKTWNDFIDYSLHLSYIIYRFNEVKQARADIVDDMKDLTKQFERLESNFGSNVIAESLFGTLDAVVGGDLSTHEMIHEIARLLQD